MKKLLTTLLAGLMILSLVGCGSTPASKLSDPSKSKMQKDVSDYITNVLVPGANVTYFTVEDGAVEEGNYNATCLATYESSTTRYLDEFELSYVAGDGDWEIEKISLVEGYPQRSETPLDGAEVEEPTEETAEETETEDVEETTETTTEVVMSDNLNDFTFTLGGVVYQLPMPYTTMAANGWTISSSGTYEDTLVAANDYEYVTMANAGNKVTVYIINLSGNAKAISDCKVGGIDVDANYISDPSFFTIAKGINVASTVDDIQNALGSPNDYNQHDDYVSMKYAPNDNEYNIKTSFTVYTNGDTKYNSIELKNYVADESDITETSDAVPDYLASYVDPEIDTDKGLLAEAYFTLDGKTYNLPCPVSQFTANGWNITSKPNAVGAGNSEYITIQKGDDKLDLSIGNYAEYQTIPENCAVYKVSADEYYMKGKIEFNFFGIKIGTPEADVQALVNAAKDEWDFSESTYSNTYSYYSPYNADRDISLYIRVDNETGKVSDINVSGKTWAY